MVEIIIKKLRYKFYKLSKMIRSRDFLRCGQLTKLSTQLVI